MSMAGPGSYNDFDSMKKTQWKTISSIPKRSEKNISFIEKYNNIYKLNPAPNYYKKVDKAFDKATHFIA